MTLHPIPSEFPNICRKFCFLFVSVYNIWVCSVSCLVSRFTVSSTGCLMQQEHLLTLVLQTLRSVIFGSCLVSSLISWSTCLILRSFQCSSNSRQSSYPSTVCATQSLRPFIFDPDVSLSMSSASADDDIQIVDEGSNGRNQQ